MHWYRGTWYWPENRGCWHAQYDLTSWLFGVRVYLGDFEVHVGPFSFGYTDII